jgi:hypothetical protein
LRLHGVGTAPSSLTLGKPSDAKKYGISGRRTAESVLNDAEIANRKYVPRAIN